MDCQAAALMPFACGVAVPKYKPDIWLFVLMIVQDRLVFKALIQRKQWRRYSGNENTDYALVAGPTETSGFS